MKKLTALMVNGPKTVMAALPEQVEQLRRGMRLAEGVVEIDGVTMVCAHVIAFTAEDIVEPAPAVPVEDDCNS